MSQQIAHNIEEKERTEDIQTSENVDFTSMLLSKTTLRGLEKQGFKKPSPIQLKAIPMGRCGFDLILKAKSGTGKTAVFGIIALEMVNVEQDSLQVLILAPTREIAVQIQQVLLNIGENLKGLRVEYFIGGTAIEEDLQKLQHCHIAVGAPGRVKHLIQKSALNVENVRLFILDEADKLMLESYQMDVNCIYNKLPQRKQVIAVSATYPDELDYFVAKYMNTPVHISPDSEVPILLGLRQFVSVIDSHLNVIQQVKLKTEELIRILSTINFTQCMVFSNYQTRAESLSNILTQRGWPAISISGAQSQAARLTAVNNLKDFKCRILSTTDLTARGIDAANVDLVINIDVPRDLETYLHRMGRAGRYGSYGICITIASEGNDVENLQKILGNIGNSQFSICKFPKSEEKIKDIWNCDLTEFEQLEGILENEENDVKMEETLDTVSMNKIAINKSPEEQIMEEILEKMEQTLDEVSKKKEILVKNPEEQLMEEILENKEEKMKQTLEEVSKKKEIVVKNPEQLMEKILENKQDEKMKQTLDEVSKKKEIVIKNPEQLMEGILENKEDEKMEQTLNNISMKKQIIIKNPEQLITVSKEEILSKAMSQLKNLLLYGNSVNTNINDVISVENLLQSIAEESERSRREMNDKYRHLESKIIISSLANGELLLTKDTKIQKSKSKKIKQNEYANKSNCTQVSEISNAECSTSTNSQYQNEAKLFQENFTLNKNIALYNITKFLVNEKDDVSDCNKSIDNLLDMIKQENSSELSKIDFENLKIKNNALCNITKVLTDSSVNNENFVENIEQLLITIKEENSLKKIELEETVLLENFTDVSNILKSSSLKTKTDGSVSENSLEKDVKNDQTNEKLVVKCGCPESIFTRAFDNAVSINKKYWKTDLCHDHSYYEWIDVNNCTEEEEEMEDVEETEEEYYEENIGESNYEEPDYGQEENNAVVMDEELFTKAFDYATYGNGKEVYVYYENQEMSEDNTNEETEENSNEAYGYTADYVCPLLNKLETKESNKRKRSKTNEICFVSSEKQYETYFEYYNNLLLDTAPNFTDVSSFESWHRKWQENVFAVRNYVQQDVFAKEIMSINKNN